MTCLEKVFPYTPMVLLKVYWKEKIVILQSFKLAIPN